MRIYNESLKMYYVVECPFCKQKFLYYARKGKPPHKILVRCRFCGHSFKLFDEKNRISRFLAKFENPWQAREYLIKLKEKELKK